MRRCGQDEMYLHGSSVQKQLNCSNPIFARHERLIVLKCDSKERNALHLTKSRGIEGRGASRRAKRRAYAESWALMTSSSFTLSLAKRRMPSCIPVTSEERFDGAIRGKVRTLESVRTGRLRKEKAPKNRCKSDPQVASK